MEEKTASTVKVAVVILNWNGKHLLEQFLPSVVKHSHGPEAEVIVADNGSSDDSLLFLKKQFPQVKTIQLDQNYGFAEGYNKALLQVESEYVVLLNSDIETTENWLEPLVNYMDAHPNVVAAQPKILACNQKTHFEYAGAAGGFIDKYGYPFCRGRILQTTEIDNHQYDEPLPIFWASGACLFIRRNHYFEAGGLDGRFFAHMEEIDMCWRLNARGHKIMCLPESVVYHVGAASLAQESPRKTYLNFRNNLLMLYKNMPAEKLNSVMRMRGFLDLLAFFHLCLRGKIHNAKAVIKARRDFSKLKISYMLQRQENMQKTTTDLSHLIYNESILWNYYVKGKKKYADLKRKGG